MKPYEAYTTYLAMKNHFEKDGYDFFRYGGKVTAKVESFYARKDKYFFEKLARKDDLVNFMMANFLEKEKVWSRDLVQEDADKIYRDWVKRTQSLSYLFSEDLEKIEDIKAALAVHDGQHPELLRLMMSHKVSVETVIVLESLIGFMKNWDEKIEDAVIWPSQRRKLKKYRPFLKFDPKKFGDMVIKKYRR